MDEWMDGRIDRWMEGGMSRYRWMDRKDPYHLPDMTTHLLTN
jgi:hypothetical protein